MKSLLPFFLLLLILEMGITVVLESDSLPSEVCFPLLSLSLLIWSSPLPLLVLLALSDY